MVHKKRVSLIGRIQLPFERELVRIHEGFPRTTLHLPCSLLFSTEYMLQFFFSGKFSLLYDEMRLYGQSFVDHHTHMPYVTSILLRRLFTTFCNTARFRRSSSSQECLVRLWSGLCAGLLSSSLHQHYHTMSL